MIYIKLKKRSSTEFSNEQKLLLSCLQLKSQTRYFKINAILDHHSIDWHHFLRLTKFHKVIPPVYQCLKQHTHKNIPDYLLASLRKYSCEITLKNTLHVEELKQLLNLFETHDIDVIPFKGPTLAQIAYGGTHARQFCDLDFLVSRKDFKRCVNLLISLNYRSPYVNQGWNYSILYKIIKNFHYDFIAHEISFGKRKQDCNVFIDLHQNISKYCPESFEIFSDRLLKIKLQQQYYQSLKTEDLLNVLCIHNSQDGWKKFQAIYDVANLVDNNPTLNWPDVLKLSQELRCRRRLLLGLALCKSYFDIDLSDSIENMILTDQIISDLIGQIDLSLKNSPVSRRTFSMKIRFQFMKMQMLESFYYKQKVLFDFVWYYLFDNFYRAKVMTMPFSK
ncbi:nucleotidyltransferase domain-containing protein [Acaryochloris marina]|uniref:Nucleotidyltransferase family protein n=1 Tax=Acaryochloris marina (strain MBIC 11017) TaxID=329726 RepID=B0CA05_ACAM1|nr:nucleotidyltransferase family protein [Acaryochloris marina]ABW25445.1 hypothetical protein AM1_0388 [Acaryochloris marina MBIC11017]